MLSLELQRKIQRIYIKSKRLANDVFSGEYVSAFRGRGMEFEEVREYSPGDDIRSIDWNVTSRMDKPYVKVFREEREQTLILLVDASFSLDFGSKHRTKREIVTEIAAVLAYAAIKSNDKVGLLIFTDRIERFIPPKKGRSHVWQVISEILSFSPEGRGSNLTLGLQYLIQAIRRRAIVFVISDFLVEGSSQALKVANIKHDVVSVMMQDPLEMQFPTGGLIPFEDLETGELNVVDMGNKKTRQAWLNDQGKRIREQIQHLQSLRLDCLSLQTDQDYIGALLQYFKLREKRT